MVSVVGWVARNETQRSRSAMLCAGFWPSLAATQPTVFWRPSMASHRFAHGQCCRLGGKERNPAFPVRNAGFWPSLAATQPTVLWWPSMASHRFAHGQPNIRRASANRQIVSDSPMGWITRRARGTDFPRAARIAWASDNRSISPNAASPISRASRMRMMVSWVRVISSGVAGQVKLESAMAEPRVQVGLRLGPRCGGNRAGACLGL